MDKLISEAAKGILSGSPVKFLDGRGNNDRNVFYQRDECDSFYKIRTQILESLESNKSKSKQEASVGHVYRDNCYNDIDVKERLITTKALRTDEEEQIWGKHETNREVHLTSNEERSKEVIDQHSSTKLLECDRKTEAADDICESTTAEKRKITAREMIANVSVLDAKRFDDNSSDLSNGFSTKCDLKRSDEDIFTEQINRQCSKEAITLKKVCGNQKTKQKLKPVYVCSNCGVSYNLTHKSMLLVTKCLNCDYWTPEDPEFKKAKKTESSECKVS